MTRLELIRNMSDNEFAYFLCDFVSSDCILCSYCKAKEHCYVGHNGMLDYLNEEEAE